MRYWKLLVENPTLYGLPFVVVTVISALSIITFSTDVIDLGCGVFGLPESDCGSKPFISWLRENWALATNFLAWLSVILVIIIYRHQSRRIEIELKDRVQNATDSINKLEAEIRKKLADFEKDISSSKSDYHNSIQNFAMNAHERQMQVRASVDAAIQSGLAQVRGIAESALEEERQRLSMEIAPLREGLEALLASKT
jgi:hypothetical protein